MATNHFENYTDNEVVIEHLQHGANSYHVSEMLRRLMLKLASQHQATDQLTKSIRRLNAWLLWFTVAIFALTVVLVLLGLNILRPLR